jgi:hypothetical protein
MAACAGEHAEAGRADDESGDQQDPGPSRGTGVDPVVRGLDVVRALGEQRDALEHPEAATDDGSPARGVPVRESDLGFRIRFC